jgi:outer membrane protein
MQLFSSHFMRLILFFVIIPIFAQSQEKWDLRRCIEYAWDYSISVKQADIQARIADLAYKQNKLSQYPNVSFTNSTGTNFGRAVDPTSNLFISSTLLFQQYNMNVSGLIYNWGNLRNTILSAEYGSLAARKDVERLKNDIGLTVATTFLQVLLAKEQVRIAQNQMDITRSRIRDTRLRVDAGQLPELNALELEAQYARDSSAYISSVTIAEQNLLTLKATLNVDAFEPFDIEEPPVSRIPVEKIENLTPEKVYTVALQTQPQQQVNELRIKSLQYNLKAAKASFYPSVNWFGGIGTNFANPNTKLDGFVFLGYRDNGGFSPIVSIGGNTYPVQEPIIGVLQSKKTIGEMWNGWNTQIGDNFRQNIGVQLSVPLFNGGVARTNYRRIRYDIENAEWIKKQSEQKLKNDIYQAYQSALNAGIRFEASKKTEALSARAFELTQKRYDAGLLQTIEWITSQNNLFRARIQLLADQFDYVFRMKVLEFYKGLGLNL